MSGNQGVRQTYGKKNPNLPFHPAVRAGIIHGGNRAVCRAK